MKYWVEQRGEGDKLETGTCVPALSCANNAMFPFVVMTSKSISALGELVCVCTSLEQAELVADALECFEDEITHSGQCVPRAKETSDEN